MLIYRAENYWESYCFTDYEMKEDIDVLGYFFTKESAQNEILINTELNSLLKVKGRIIEIEVKE